MSDYIPKDVLIDILKRLPVKTLVRCTCACKSWYSLITNPSFISTHFNHTIENNKETNNNHLLFIRHYDMFHKIERYALHFDTETFDEYLELECPLNSNSEYFRIVGTCNGLICLSDDYDTYTDTIFLWNPLMKKTVTLPKPQLAYNGRGSCVLGFGFDSVRNDYKVVRIVYHTNLPEDNNFEIQHKIDVLNNQRENYNYRVPPRVEIYSLSTGTWRNLCDGAPSYVVYGIYSHSAFVNGAIHWVASTDDDDGSERSLIAAFNMGAEVFRVVKKPVGVTDNVLKLSVMVLGGSLALIEYEKFWQSEKCWVWVMQEYGVVESWTKLLTIDMRDGLRTVVGFRANNEVLVSARVVGLVSNDTKGNEITYLGIHGTNRSFYANNYVESLTLIKRVNRLLGQANPGDAVTEEASPFVHREEDGVGEQQ